MNAVLATGKDQKKDLYFYNQEKYELYHRGEEKKREGLDERRRVMNSLWH